MNYKELIINKKKIHYRDEGSGDVLVLIHGYMNSLEVWSTYLLFLMREMRVITIDMPGHGKSDAFGEEHTMEFMASVVKAVLNHLDVKECVMVGHSMGGYVTLAFAEKYPNALKGFGLLHSHALSDSDIARKNRMRACEIAIESRAGYIVKFIPDLFAERNRMHLYQEIKELQDLSLEMQVEGIVAAQRGMAARESKIHILESTTVPVLFIFGKEDSRIPIEEGMAQAMIPNHSEITILSRVGHMGHIETPIIVRERIRAFVHQCYFQV